MSRRGYVRDLLSRESRSDIYLGVVAPTGIPRAPFVGRLRRHLEDFGYELEVYRLSGYLGDLYPELVVTTSEHDRLRTCMDAGSRFREEHEDDALVTAALTEVAAVRAQRESHEGAPISPIVHLFWSLKHPGEVAALRAVYGRGFHLIGLFAPKEDRVQLLLDRDGISGEQARKHIERDQAEQGRSHGQQTRKTFQHADVFLEWGTESAELERFLDLAFGNPFITPRESEHWMFLAYANSVRAGELSRQVGAALVSKEGDLLGLGANDAPRRGGGLYWPNEDDDRDCARRQDANSIELREMLRTIVDQVQEKGLLRDEETAGDQLLEVLREGPLRALTEYGRAVHAEMDALLSACRTGISTRGATIYVTTYPCHNCARHLIAAGVERIVFVEPYPKSKALRLHGKDLVEVDRSKSEDEDRVLIEPYLGVGARRYLDYFSMHLSSGQDLVRKNEDGSAATWQRSAASPRTPLFRRNHIEIERDLASLADPGDLRKEVEDSSHDDGQNDN